MPCSIIVCKVKKVKLVHNFFIPTSLGCKWTFRQLRRYFEQSGYFDWILWQKISCLVTLTILSQAAGIPKSSNCFEFFGFDVLIDENLKPWLLEVNMQIIKLNNSISRYRNNA